MKYKYMDENGHVRQTIIPESYLERNTQALGITKNEAAEMYLSDEGIIVNAEVRRLTDKANQSKMAKADAKNSKARRPQNRKPLYEKRAIINAVRAVLDDPLSYEDKFKGTAADVRIINPERIISFTLGKNEYEISVIKKRSRKV